GSSVGVHTDRVVHGSATSRSRARSNQHQPPSPPAISAPSLNGRTSRNPPPLRPGTLCDRAVSIRCRAALHIPSPQFESEDRRVDLRRTTRGWPSTGSCRVAATATRGSSSPPLASPPSSSSS
ncbi:hypothetical protein Zm00014a_044511, partial [Zea mays]